MSHDSRHELDEILTHRAWVAGLARSLLFDQAQVDDVVQETWMVALKSRPRDPAATRAWLGSIVRNLVGRRIRGDGRRRRRETAAAVSEHAPGDGGGAGAGGVGGVDDLVAQTELHRKLVEAVLALDEPYRSTVLLRYFRDLSAEDIAREAGVPGSTVRNRLRRALELLRVRLDRTAGGGGGGSGAGDGGGGGARRAWMLALMPLALAPELAAGVVAGAGTATATATATGTGSAAAAGTLKTATALGAGVALMTVKTKVLGGLVAVMATVFGVWWALESGDGEVVGAPAGGAVGMVVPAGVEPGKLDAGRTALPTVDRAEPSSLAADPAGAALAEPPEGELLTGVVVDDAGAPIVGAQVRFAWHAQDTPRLLGVVTRFSFGALRHLTPTRGVQTDSDGRFALRQSLDMDSNWLQRTLLVVLHPDFVTRVHVNAPLTSDRTNDLGTIRMAPGATVVGRTVDELGRPLEGVFINLLELRPSSTEDTRSGAALPTVFLAEAQRTVIWTRSDSQGRFRLSGLPPGGVDLQLERSDLVPVVVRDLALEGSRSHDLGTWTLTTGRSLWGVVLLHDGTPVAGAQVYTEARDAPDWRGGSTPPVIDVRMRGLTFTDEKGRFRFGGLADAIYSVHAYSEGNALAHIGHATPDEGPLELTLSPPGEILLHVEDSASGEPLSDATIWASLPQEFEELERSVPVSPGLRTRSVPDPVPGEYRITGAGREGTLVRVRVDGYKQERFEIGPVGPEQTVEHVIRLVSAESVSGFVIDDAGDPVEGASVQISSESSGGTMGTHTDAQGAFSLSSASTGDWTLWVNHDGYQNAQAWEVSLPRENDAPYVVRLLRSAIVEGVVRDHENLPVAGASVVALPARFPSDGPVDRWNGLAVSLTAPQPAHPVITSTDETGTYRFLDLHPGDWVLVATHAADIIRNAFRDPVGIAMELPEETVRTQASAGESTLVPLQIAEDARVVGRVTDEGVPVAAARVRLVPTPDTAKRWLSAIETHTDEQGLYSLEIPVEGPAVLVISAEDGYPHLMPVDLMRGKPEEANLDLAGLSLSGRVVDARSREPLAGARVIVSASGPDGWESPAFPGMDAARTNRLHRDVLQPKVTLTTGDDGRFVAGNLPAANYSARARASAHLEHQEQVEVLGDGSDPESVTIALPRAAIVTGTVTTRDGTPMTRVLVELHPRNEDRVVNRGYPKDSRWTIDPVDAGAWELRLVTWDDENTVLATEFLTVGIGDAPVVEFVVD